MWQCFECCPNPLWEESGAKCPVIPVRDSDCLYLGYRKHIKIKRNKAQGRW